MSDDIEPRSFEGSPSRPLRRLWPLVLAALCVSASLPITDAWGLFASQTVDATNRFSAGTLQLESTVGSASCFSTGVGTGGTVSSNITQCAGSPLPSGELSASTVTTATSTLASVGTSTGTQGSVALLSCGVAQAADSSGSSDTGLLYGGVTYGTAFSSPVHPTFSSTGVTLDGAAGSFVGTLNSLTSPSPVTVVAWVNTTSTIGGSIIGLATKESDDDGSNHEDRMLWVDPSGFVVFGVQKSSTEAELTSSVKVNNGNWHFVAATFSNAGLTLDVDGHVSSSTALTSVTSYSGYWHLGWSGNASWADAGTDEYLAGSLSGVAVFNAAITSANLNTLNNAASAGLYASDVSALSPAEEWLLADTGSVPYTGAVSNSTPCQRVLIEVQTTLGSTTTCAYPAGTSACSTNLPNADLLSSLTTSSMVVPSATLPVTVLVRMELKSASPVAVAGLHLLADVAFSASVGSWSAKVAYPSTNLQM